jgi:hypothetical protein
MAEVENLHELGLSGAVKGEGYVCPPVDVGFLVLGGREPVCAHARGLGLVVQTAA